MAHAGLAGVVAAPPMPPLLDYARLAATPLRRDPFDHLLVLDFVVPAAQAALIADFPRIDGPGNVTPGTVPQGPSFDRLIAELESDRFRAAIGRQLDVDLAGTEPTIGVRVAAEPTDGRIHCDHRSKRVTLLLYFNERWDAPGGRLRMCRNQHDIDDFTTEVLPVSGTLIAFRNGPDAWHGHQQHVGPRKMLQLSFRDMHGMVGLERQLARWTKPIRRMLNRS